MIGSASAWLTEAPVAPLQSRPRSLARSPASSRYVFSPWLPPGTLLCRPCHLNLRRATSHDEIFPWCHCRNIFSKHGFQENPKGAGGESFSLPGGYRALRESEGSMAHPTVLSGVLPLLSSLDPCSSPSSDTPDNCSCKATRHCDSRLLGNDPSLDCACGLVLRPRGR